MSAADAVKELEKQLEALKQKVAEEERETRRKTEEAERKRQQEEEKRAKREREKKEKAKKEQARKRKAPEPDAEVPEKTVKSAKSDLIYPRRGCDKCREKGLKCAFRPGKRTTTSVQCQHAKTAPCVGVKGLPDAELQARLDRKAVATPVDSPRKRARKSEPVFIIV
ncbi:hypothetical protein FKP32DRAFT_1675462, partial [Trametes sanguinea]